MIITDEKALRVICQMVLPDEVNDLRIKLEQALSWSAQKGFPGVGLACPQIGIAKNMAIVRINGHISFDLVNAKIAHLYNPFIFDNEGCLSFPNKWVKSKRYKEVVIEGNCVIPNRFVITDFAAVVACHELDHLNGVLLPDVEISE